MEYVKNLNGIAYEEVLNILRKMEPEYSSKVPIEFIRFLMENATQDEQYTGFDANGNIQVSSQAELILDYFNLEYWADTEEKEELIKIYQENDNALREKYSTDNLFKSQEKEPTNEVLQEEKRMIETKNENLLKRLFNKIKKYFQKN